MRVSNRSLLGALWLGRSRAAIWKRALVIAAVIPFFSLYLGQLRFFRVVELKTEDLRFRERGPRPIHPDLLILDIDDRTMDAYGGQYPLPRSQHAVLLLAALDAGAAVVGFDLIITSPAADPDEDILLSYVICKDPSRVVIPIDFREAGEVPRGSRSFGFGKKPREHLKEGLLADSLVAVFDSELTPGNMPEAYRGVRASLPPQPYRECGAGIGHITFLKDHEVDGSQRRVPLFFQSGSYLVPALAMACWLQHAGLRASDVRVDRRGALLRRTDDVVLAILRKDALHEIDYAGDETAFASQRMSYIDAITLAKQSRSPESAESAVDLMRRRFEGKIVLVGLTSVQSYSLDLGSTPLSTNTPLLYVHASLLNDLLQGRSVRRPPAWIGLLLTAVFLCIVSGIGPRLHPAMWLALTLAILLAVLVASQQLFNRASIMLDLVPLVLTLVFGYLFAAVFAYVAHESERRILRRTFDRYVSSDLLEGILENAGNIQLGGELREVTVLFVDIRGFTAWTRSMEPQALVSELNAFLSEMVQGIFAFGGAVNMFLGDAILATFGAPISHDDDAVRAVRAARALYSRLSRHNEQRAASSKSEIQLGIGIATGPVIAGNIGSNERLEFTVIGNAVNLAARLQALSKDGGILVDRTTMERIGSALHELRFDSIGCQELKGIEEPVEVFGVTERHA